MLVGALKGQRDAITWRHEQMLLALLAPLVRLRLLVRLRVLLRVLVRLRLRLMLMPCRRGGRDGVGCGSCCCGGGSYCGGGV